jgi:hypothetical protein
LNHRIEWPLSATADSRFVTIEVLRASKRQNYSVPTERTGPHAAALSGHD